MIIKKLYETNFFKNINLDFSNNVLKINVEENPLIQSLVFEGIKKQSLIEKIKDILIQKRNHLLSKVKLKKIEIEL